MNDFSNKMKLLAVFVLLATLLVAAPGSYAQNDEANVNQAATGPAQADAKAESNSAMLASDLSEIEYNGLWTLSSEGSLGSDLWEETPRSFLIEAFSTLPAEAANSSIQRLLTGALFTETDGGILNDIEPQAGRDFLTLRLEKALEAGAYKQAFDVYMALEGDAYHEKLADAGILAMIYNGEKSLACIEVHTLLEQFADAAFLSTVGRWCDASLSEAPAAEEIQALQDQGYNTLAQMIADPNQRFAYQAEAFTALKPLERAALAAEKRIDTPELTTDSVLKIPAQHLQLLIAQDNLSAQNQFLLLTRMIDRGLTKPEELKRLYISAMEPAAGKDFVAPDPATLPDWQKLAYYFYLGMTETDDTNRWQIVREALPFGRIYGYAALSPFAPLISDLDVSQVSYQDIILVYKTLSKAGLRIPENWTSLADRSAPEFTAEPGYSSLIAATYVSKPRSQRTAEEAKKIIESAASLEVNHRHLITNVIENVDKASLSGDNAHKIYENKKNLTFSQDYVMPSVFVWDYLLKANQNGNKGQVVLLSVAALHETPLQNAYPGLLVDVLQGLSKVGLTDISNEVAIAAVLGDIK